MLAEYRLLSATSPSNKVSTAIIFDLTPGKGGVLHTV
jgi:hypothetical protein